MQRSWISLNEGHDRPEDLALPAQDHLLLPCSLNLPMAKRSIDEPAQMSQPVLPGRATLPGLFGTIPGVPAVLLAFS